MINPLSSASSPERPHPVQAAGLDSSSLPEGTDILYVVYFLLLKYQNTNQDTITAKANAVSQKNDLQLFLEDQGAAIPFYTIPEIHTDADIRNIQVKNQMATAIKTLYQNEVLTLRQDVTRDMAALDGNVQNLNQNTSVISEFSSTLQTIGQALIQMSQPKG